MHALHLINFCSVVTVNTYSRDLHAPHYLRILIKDLINNGF